MGEWGDEKYLKGIFRISFFEEIEIGTFLIKESELLRVFFKGRLSTFILLLSTL